MCELRIAQKHMMLPKKGAYDTLCFVEDLSQSLLCLAHIFTENAAVHCEEGNFAQGGNLTSNMKHLIAQQKFYPLQEDLSKEYLWAGIHSGVNSNHGIEVGPEQLPASSRQPGNCERAKGPVE